MWSSPLSLSPEAWRIIVIVTPPSQMLPFLVLIAKEVGGAVGGLINGLKVETSVFDEEWISQCAVDLVDSKGESVVVLVGSRFSSLAVPHARGRRSTTRWVPLERSSGRNTNTIFPNWERFQISLRRLPVAGWTRFLSSVKVILLFDAPADSKFAESLQESRQYRSHWSPREFDTAKARDLACPGNALPGELG